MRYPRSIWLVAGVSLFVVALATASLPNLFASDVNDSPESPRRSPGLFGVARDALPTRLQRIRDVLEAESRRLAALQAEFREAESPEDARAIQAAMHALKTQTELTVLQIQLQQARIEGRSHDAELLQTILDEAAVQPDVPESDALRKRASERPSRRHEGSQR